MIRKTLLVACFASATGSGWVRRAHKRKQRNATQPQLQPVTSEDVSRYFAKNDLDGLCACLLYTSPSPRDMRRSRMPSSA